MCGATDDKLVVYTSEWPDDPTRHRILGISHFRAGNTRFAARHLEVVLMLLGRATTPGISLLLWLRIEFEASVVRLALMAAYKRLTARFAAIPKGGARADERVK